nr:YopX family protein [Levilactobacillus brevis]
MMVPKFRAWNGYRKIMADYVSAIQNGDTQGTPSSVNVIVNGKNETWDIKNDHVELLQFTGLKDEGDVNIYEGDIVCVSDVYGDVGYVDAVIWGGKDDYPAFDLKNHAMEYDSNALSSIANAGFEIIEVIGNIYTNPELLEAQHDTRTD